MLSQQAWFRLEKAGVVSGFYKSFSLAVSCRTITTDDPLLYVTLYDHR